MRPLVSITRLLFVLALLAPAAAKASPLFELTGAPVGGGGFNGRVSGASAASTYFNPALLPRAKQGLTLGTMLVNDAISLTLDGRGDDVDLPLESLDHSGLDVPPLPTRWLEQGCSAETEDCASTLEARPRQSDGSSGNLRFYQVLGLVNRVLDDRLVLGMYAMIPMGSFTTAHAFFVDEREQFFSNSLHPELYGDRLTATSLAFGAGSQITDWLSAGVVFTLALKNVAAAGAYAGNSIDLAGTLQLSTEVDVSASVSPHLGLYARPIESLGLSLTVHTPQKMEIVTEFGSFLPNGDLQIARRTAVHAWLPLNLSAGAEWATPLDSGGSFALRSSVTFGRWSQYVNRQNERVLDDPRHRAYRWEDVVTPALGARLGFNESSSCYLDLNFQPTPIPDQTGRTNYVDNHRVGAMLGFDHDFSLAGLAFTAGASAQSHLLIRRSQSKFDPTAPRFDNGTYSQLVVDEWPDDTEDLPFTQADESELAQGLQTNNPGWPGFTSEGFILAGSFHISMHY